MVWRYFTGAAFGLALTVAVPAADHSSPFDPPPLRQSYGPMGSWDWSGPYIGAHLGLGWGGNTNDWSTPPLYGWTRDGDMDYRSAAAGMQAGYQRQTGQMVIGLEADLSLAHLTASDDGFQGRTNDMTIGALGTLRGRLGWAAGNMLVYGTGGVAAAHLSKNDTADGIHHTGQLATGWAAGAGVEWGLSENISLRAEYLHLRLGDVETALVVPGGMGYMHRANAPTINLLRIGANYRF